MKKLNCLVFLAGLTLINLFNGCLTNIPLNETKEIISEYYSIPSYQTSTNNIYSNKGNYLFILPKEKEIIIHDGIKEIIAE